MAKISKAKLKEQENARKNRQELIGVDRRDLMKMGLLTGAGFLVPKRGLSARARNSAGWLESGSGSDGSSDDIPCMSPPTTPFVEEMPNHMNGGMVIHTPVAAFSNEAACPAQAAPSGCPNDGRKQAHQAFAQRPPVVKYEVSQRRTLKSVHPALPPQPLWGFARRQADGPVDPNTNTGLAWTPGPTFVARYNEAILVRNFNDLPPKTMNDGFGLPSVTTHLHNGHTPSESDGFPCDYFERGQFYDQHYPNVLAGINSTHPGTGDINESLSTLWYHDHRIEFTAPNVYKGLAGFYLLFNELDTGDENTGFKLPSFPEFDIPMIITDRSFSPQTGLLCFDMFNLDGILGDRFLVNGKIQPFFNVQARRYRFRILDGGPSRFYRLHLLDPTSPSTVNRFWHIANDGNLLPRPLLVDRINLGVAERHDIIIDFRPFAGKTLYLENRLKQDDGRGPDGEFFGAGQGNRILKINVGAVAPDGSADPATQTFYPLPPRPTPRITRTFRFDRTNGQWAINNQLMPGDCSDIRFRVQRNSGERWILQNNSGGWQHPIHIHFEESQLIRRNGRNIQAGDVEFSRKNIVRLNLNDVPLKDKSDGFGLPPATTQLHDGHTNLGGTVKAVSQTLSKYDVFIYAGAYSDYGSHISGRLREADFSTYLWIQQGTHDKRRSRRAVNALEHSASCALLFGPDMQSPLADEWLRSAIKDRVERTRGEYRVILVLLPGASKSSTRSLVDEMCGFETKWPVFFREGDGEKESLHQLILAIRGVGPRQSADWQGGRFREAVRRRAENALNVDWADLARGIRDPGADMLTSEHKERPMSNYAGPKLLPLNSCDSARQPEGQAARHSSDVFQALEGCAIRLLHEFSLCQRTQQASIGFASSEGPVPTQPDASERRVSREKRKGR